MSRSYTFEVYNASGDDLDTDYTYGRTVYPSASDYKTMTLYVRVTPTDSGGADITSVTVTVEARGDDDDAWTAITGVDINTQDQATEQAYTSLPSDENALNYGPISIDPSGLGQIRVGVKVEGTPGTNDAVRVMAVAVQA